MDTRCDLRKLLRGSSISRLSSEQFQAITGSAGWAVLIQAIVFGIGHLYEGVDPVASITLFGVLFVLLALWQKSLRPGMIADAWSDIFGVIIFRGLSVTATLNLQRGCVGARLTLCS